MAGERWIFTKPQLMETPSRKCGVDIDKELSYRQQAANLIQEMGQRLQTNQLCINTAIVYMHRFYMFHSFTKFNRNVMSPACLFLAAKVEEQPRKLEHVIRTAHSCLREGSLDPKSETYLEYAQELIINENILLQTLGFEVRVDHPHTTVVTTCQLVRASKDLAQTSYFLATNSLHLTTMCLQQKPNIVACVCIHLACKWSGYEIPSSHEGKLWFNYVDKNISIDLLEELTQDFLNILDKCPSRLKKKIMTWRSGKNGDESVKGDAGQSTSKGESASSKSKAESAHSRNIFEDSSAIINDAKSNSDRSQHPPNTASSSGSSRSTDNKSHSGHPPLNIKDYKQHKEYKERKEKERMTGQSSHASIKPHGNGDVKRSHHQGRVDPERKATQHALDSLHHMSREDTKRHEIKREHDSPIKMTIKSEKSRSHELSSKAVKRSHQSDNELSDGSERHSKHRRSETHPISNDNFPAGTINHTDLFSGQNYPASSIKVETGNGSSGSDRHSKNRTAYSEGGNNSDRAMWNSGKSSTKSPGSSSVKSSNSLRKDRSIFSPPQHQLLSHHPPPQPHMLQNKLGLNQSVQPPPRHVLTKGNMNASFDQSYQRSHPPNYGHVQYSNPNMMGNSFQDGQHSAVQGMNSNGGPIPGSNQQEMIGDIQSQLQNIINQQKYQIAQQQAQSQQPSMFDIDLLDSDLDGMPPLPPPLPQNTAPQPPPPPY